MSSKYRQIWTLALLIVFPSLQLPAAEPIELFVSPQGRDSDVGSKAAPFASIERAQGAVREALDGDRSRGVTVWMGEGTYEVKKALAFGPEDAPEGAARVTYRALDAFETSSR